MSVSVARRATFAAAILALASVAGGCGAFRRGGPAPDIAEAVVEVENHGFPDVVLYAVSAGDPFRLGMITGNGSAKFKLPARYTMAGTLQLLARPIAGRSYMLPTVTVGSGDVVQVSIESTPVQSRVIVTPREP